MTYELLPVPRSLSIQKGAAVDHRASAWVVLDPPFVPRIERHLKEMVGRWGGFFAGGLGLAASRPARGGVFLEVRRDGACEGESYRLTCAADGVRLSAGSAAGAFYGLQTLDQLVGQFGARLPSLDINDRPDFPSRGVMLDISRCKVPTMHTLRLVVDRLAALKINHLELYTEHTFAFSNHQVVWHDASPLTHGDVLDLDAYCRERFVELVPNFNSFGHFERWLRHPEYKALAEAPDGFEYPRGGRAHSGSVLYPDGRSLALIAELYAEFLPLFGSRLFNVGCDETWELGKGRSARRCERRGKTRVYLDFLLRIHRLVRRHERSMMFWGDIILRQPELIRALPRDIVALNWGYEAAHPFLKESAGFARAKVPFYVCPGTSSWGSITGRTTNCLANLANAAQAGLRNGAVGYLNTDWGDGGHHQYLPVSWLGIAAGAAYSWSFKANRETDVARAIDRLIYRDRAGVLGNLFADLGRVLELSAERPGNSSIFQHLLFWDMTERVPLIQRVKTAELRRCVKAFDAIEERLPDARPGAEDGGLVKAELANALAMARHAARRGIAAKGRAADRTALRRELQAIIGRHEELWLARNRPGGLRESSGRLRDALKPLI